ncbi:hypothetical protein [Nocardioides plantarum]|uniref:Secreted protein n=1 Tax=Nocardioides plantarum TaxID=29299 RepID=A0ABV5K9Q2_9ACTN|nr:hypothetical protein [Nocardioides plantarum]
MKHLRYAAAAAIVAGLVTTGAGTAPAHASGGDSVRVTKSGTCSHARWTIKAKEDDGRIEVEAEIDSNRSGQTWRWVLNHNGSRSATGTARTAGRSGSFSIERRLPDAKGSDAFTFKATHGSQVCTARVRYPA